MGLIELLERYNNYRKVVDELHIELHIRIYANGTCFLATSTRTEIKFATPEDLVSYLTSAIRDYDPKGRVYL